MSERVDLMGAGVRAGGSTAILGSFDHEITLTVIGESGSSTIRMPVYAFRHLMERGALKVAEVEALIAEGPVEPRVPRRTEPTDSRS